MGVNPIVDGVAGPVVGLITDIIDRIFPDKDRQSAERAQLILQAQQIDADLAKGQMAVNEREAASNSLFIAGGRPFVIWICGFGLAYHTVLQPLLLFIMAALGHNFPLPLFDTEMLSTAMTGLLGLGGLRSVEKMGDKGHLPWQH